MFSPAKGPALIGYIAGALVVSGLLFFALTLVPVKFRKPLISGITFLAGLYYVLEFFLPVGAAGKEAGQNFLTPYLPAFAQVNQVLLSFAGGVGIFSLLTVHSRAIVRQRAGWGFSLTLLAALFGIAIFGFLKEYRPNSYNAGIYRLLFDGAYKNLQAAMFSIISFYIVSAAYRAFRLRSVEATLLLASAFLVILGQVPMGQAITAWLPTEGFASSLRLEVIRDWILTRVSSPALLAVDLGLGMGLLSTAIRLWLSLERGSYFDREV
ncbi:MAG: hypothetical protein H7Z41_03255 [Cytophagales bacterium]|nr:hypothetical protein [Armatimonadota bacterium]